MTTYIIFATILYVTSYIAYIKLSHGLGHKAEYLQLRRFLPCGLLAVLPMYLANASLISVPYIISLLVGISWIVTYPLFYYLTYHKTSSDFGFHLDTVFGLYVIGWLVAIKILLIHFNVFPQITLTFVSLLELSLFLIPVAQWGYYLLYGTCVDLGAITLIFETYLHEVLEFFNSLPLLARIITPLTAILFTATFVIGNQRQMPINIATSYHLLTLIAVTIFLSIYLWNTKKGVFIRTGLIELILDVKDYLQQTATYKTNLEKRIASLKVESTKAVQPITHILIIGESASRDYMSAFCDYPQDTTPWLNKMRNTHNYLTFPYAYSCKDQTVPSLERALTECNQYNNLKFYESCSIIDIARKAGFKVSWFSNQSHIGGADTPVTLVANTADKAEWTKLHLNQAQYDESLLDYLKQVNPQENNFIVLHLKGSHFNFINRYPQTFAKFSKPNKYDLIPNYIDSLAYTDYILQQVIDYAQKHLHLQTLVYFSDHATIPDKRRSPNFGGFANVRIPLFTYLSDEYIATNPDIYANLQKNQNKYWTNDLAYELICGILNIKSNHYDEANSLTSSKYKYTREMLKTNLGQLNISDDIDK